MADISKIAEKGKDIFVALERLTFELPIARILIVFFLFCDCFMVVATGKSFLKLGWEAGKETTLGGVVLCVAAFSFTMTVIAPFCLQAVLWLWFNLGTEIVFAVQSRLPHQEEKLRPDVEEILESIWKVPPSPRERKLEQGFVSFSELHEHALKEQSPFVFKLAEERQNEFRTERNEFIESSRTAYWSIMVVLLTSINLFLGWKPHNSVLWIVIEKLKLYSLSLWILGVAYLFATIWPLIEFIKTDLDEWRESRRKPIFYPPLAEKLLQDVQQERRDKEQSFRAHLEGWKDARPLEVVYPPRVNTSAALQIAERLRALVDYLGCCEYCLKPEVTVARVSECLGYESVATLEAVLSGNRPLPFSEAQLICEIFGINRKWLLDGESGPFKRQRVYSGTEDFFRALALNQLTWGDQKMYHKLLFILPSGDYTPTLVYGQRDQSACRFDLLLNNVLIYTEDSSHMDLFDFCLAAAEICRPHYFIGSGRDHSYSILDQESYILTKDEQYQQISGGHVHLSWVLREPLSRPWVEDIWDLEFTKTRVDSYTKAFAVSYQEFVDQAEKNGITSNEQLHKYIENRITDMQHRHRRQMGTQKSTADV